MICDSCILLFVKSPAEGNVKSRLAQFLGEGPTITLYKHFVADILDTLRKSGNCVIVCHYPPDSRREIVNWIGDSYLLHPQRGADLGERMKNSFEETFPEGFSRVVLIGSDIPDLPCEIVQRAFTSLMSHDAVIGPARDGGYYLIGFRQDTFVPAAFAGIAWSSDTVFRQTMCVLEDSGCKVQVLPEWRDVDTFDDLRDLLARNRDRDFRHSRTFSFLRTMKQFSG